MLIDTTRCKNCKRCIDACATRHGGEHAGTFYTHVSLTYPLGEAASPLPPTYEGSARAKAAIVRNARWGWIPVGAGLVYQVIRWRRDAIGRIGREKTPPDKGD